MSHVTRVTFHVTDLSALRAALAKIDCGLELREGQTSIRWFGTFMGDSPVPAGMRHQDYGKCLHAISYKEGDKRAGSGYEAGLIARIDGKPGYDVYFDNFNGGYGLCDSLGRTGEKLKAAYTLEQSRREMIAQGYVVSQRTAPNGHVVMYCRKG